MYPQPDPPPPAGEGARRAAGLCNVHCLVRMIENRAPITPSPAGGGGVGGGHSVNKGADG